MASSPSLPLDSPPFLFLSLPPDLQAKILALLPVSNLLPLLTLSRSIHSLLTSPTFPSPPPDLFFLLFSSLHCQALISFHPSSNRWIALPLDSASRVFATAGSLAVTGGETGEFGTGELLAVRMFSKSRGKAIPPMIQIGDMDNPYVNPYILAILPGDDVARSQPSDHFKILAVSNCRDVVHSQVYDSLKSKWFRTGEIPYQFILLGNTALLNNSLYVHGYMPDQLLHFNLITHQWQTLIPMPSLITSSHIFSHNQTLYLIAGLEDLAVITAIRVWQLDESHGEMKWVEICNLSGTEGVFDEFTGGQGWLYHFEVVDRAGLVCLHNSITGRVLMGDVSERVMRWHLIPDCDLVGKKKRKWYGFATEMGLEVLRPGN